MDPVGFAASLVALVEFARSIYKSIERLQLNHKKRIQLQEKVQGLIQVLESAGSMSSAAAVFVRRTLDEVNDTVVSLVEPPRGKSVHHKFRRWMKGGSEEAELDKVERKLECLRTEVVIVTNMLQLKSDIPSIFNERMELPSSLSQSEPILAFLRKSQSQELRVVGIHGLPGVGKTTLVNHIWEETSSKLPFCERAHVQIGHNATQQLLCSLQSSILQQLGGERHEFTSPEGGRQKLAEHFQKLRENRRPIFFAIDNIFEANDLDTLLPSNLSAGLLPMSSAIAVTCRDLKVVRALLITCRLQMANNLQVLCYTPPCLEIEEAKAVFATYGDLCMDKDAELLDSLVPVCRGLPLALRVLGRIFVDKAKREKKEWVLIKEQMDVLDENGTETLAVTKALRLSYDGLRGNRKIAFLDVVNFFYGWPWERVERILGESVLKDLKDSSLVSVTGHWSNCNQSELREGFECSRSLLTDGVVVMHDLVLSFGKGLCPNYAEIAEARNFESTDGLLQCLQAPECIRNLMLWSSYPGGDPNLEFLKKMRSLQLLLLHAADPYDGVPSKDSEHQLSSKNAFTADQYTGLGAAPCKDGLRYLSLAGWNCSRRIMEMKLSGEIREINLYCCGDVKQLPDTPLPRLEVLSIVQCECFEDLSPLCAQNWRKLKDLKVIGSKHLTSIPAELGHLEDLRSLHFAHCLYLETFPSLCNAKGPSFLEISHCPRLRTLPSIACPLQRLSLHHLRSIRSVTLDENACVLLQEIYLSNCSFEVLAIAIGNLSLLKKLTISMCKNLKKLPPAIGSASSLQILSIEECESLVELPDKIEKMTSLTKLSVRQCKHLRALPPGIGNASSLQRLSASSCESLSELPDEVGKLISMTYFIVSGCNHLRTLPPAIGNASSLQTLAVVGCKSLVELPDEVGKLTSLTELNLRGCMSLRALPPAIGKLPSLQRLTLDRCESLVELPDEVGKLTSLTELDVGWCKHLRAQPPAIENACSLQKLSVSGCERLVELPDEVGKLTSLTVLQAGWCKHLRVLPPAIGNALSLKKLFLQGSESLVELPEEVGKLTSLTELDVSGCKSLRALPAAVGDVCSLQRLSVQGCESLVELPDEVGKLTSLTDLDVGGCMRMRALPAAFGNATSLQRLTVNDCHSLVKLPEDLGSLTELNALGCMDLRALLPAIGNASSLRKLSISGGEGVEELLEEVGNLTLLTRLSVGGACSQGLKSLPPAIGNASSLEKLLLWDCESLEELPEEVGKLTALTKFTVSRCQKLKALPAGIGNCSSLQKLNVLSCEGFVELPDEVGELTSLTKLTVNFCKMFKAVSPGLGNASSLKSLSICGCESLEELPDELGKLTSLRRMTVSGCERLKAIPAAIANCSSLRELNVERCESLEELPVEVRELRQLRVIHQPHFIN